MANHETKQIYALPYADSHDPALRGHVTSGWVEGKTMTSSAPGREDTYRQTVKDAQGETYHVDMDEHVRLQRIMAALAAKYGDMRMPGETPPKSTNHDDDPLSASRQLAESGIIDRVPGMESKRTIAVRFVSEQSDIPVNASVEAAVTPVAETKLSTQEKIDTLVEGLSDGDKLRLGYYAEALISKRVAQEYHNGQGSEENGQLAGQHKLAMSPRAQQVASQYVALYNSLHR